MHNTISLNGTLTSLTPIIDPNLPQECKGLWEATGVLVQQALKKAYLDIIVESRGGEVAAELSYLILAGKAPMVRNKRTQVGRDFDLTAHNRALSLFGCLQHGIEGRLKVGFMSKPNDSNKMTQNIKIIDGTDDDIALVASMFERWSKNIALGDNTETGFGFIEGCWLVSKKNKNICSIEIDTKKGYRCVFHDNC